MATFKPEFRFSNRQVTKRTFALSTQISEPLISPGHTNIVNDLRGNPEPNQIDSNIEDDVIDADREGNDRPQRSNDISDKLPGRGILEQSFERRESSHGDGALGKLITPRVSVAYDGVPRTSTPKPDRPRRKLYGYLTPILPDHTDDSGERSVRKSHAEQAQNSSPVVRDNAIDDARDKNAKRQSDYDEQPRSQDAKRVLYPRSPSRFKAPGYKQSEISNQIFSGSITRSVSITATLAGDDDAHCLETNIADETTVLVRSLGGNNSVSGSTKAQQRDSEDSLVRLDDSANDVGVREDVQQSSGHSSKGRYKTSIRGIDSEMLDPDETSGHKSSEKSPVISENLLPNVSRVSGRYSSRSGKTRLKTINLRPRSVKGIDKADIQISTSSRKDDVLEDALSASDRSSMSVVNQQNTADALSTSEGDAQDLVGIPNRESSTDTSGLKKTGMSNNSIGNSGVPTLSDRSSRSAERVEGEAYRSTILSDEVFEASSSPRVTRSGDITNRSVKSRGPDNTNISSVNTPAKGQIGCGQTSTKQRSINDLMESLSQTLMSARNEQPRAEKSRLKPINEPSGCYDTQNVTATQQSTEVELFTDVSHSPSSSVDDMRQSISAIVSRSSERSLRDSTNLVGFYKQPTSRELVDLTLSRSSEKQKVDVVPQQKDARERDVRERKQSVGINKRSKKGHITEKSDEVYVEENEEPVSMDLTQSIGNEMRDGDVGRTRSVKIDRIGFYKQLSLGEMKSMLESSRDGLAQTREKVTKTKKGGNSSQLGVTEIAGVIKDNEGIKKKASTSNRRTLSLRKDNANIKSTLLSGGIVEDTPIQRNSTPTATGSRPVRSASRTKSGFYKQPTIQEIINRAYEAEHLHSSQMSNEQSMPAIEKSSPAGKSVKISEAMTAKGQRKRKLLAETSSESVGSSAGVSFFEEIPLAERPVTKKTKTAGAVSKGHKRATAVPNKEDQGGRQGYPSYPQGLSHASTSIADLEQILAEFNEIATNFRDELTENKFKDSVSSLFHNVRPILNRRITRELLDKKQKKSAREACRGVKTRTAELFQIRAKIRQVRVELHGGHQERDSNSLQ